MSAGRDAAKKTQRVPDFRGSPFEKPKIDAVLGMVECGPYVVLDWPPHLLDALALIMSRDSVLSEDEVQQEVGTTTALRTLKSRIIAKLIKGGLPEEYAHAFVLNAHGRGVRRNPLLAPIVRRRGFRSDGRETLTHDFLVCCIRAAAWKLFGAKGLEQAASLLPLETRSACVPERLLHGRMIPVRYVLQWMAGVFNGPAAQDPNLFSQFLEETIDPYLALMQPELAQVFQGRSPFLWSQLNSDGQVEIRSIARGYEIRLSNHPFVADPFAARVFALVFRHIAARLNVPSPKLESFDVDMLGALRVVISASPSSSES